MAIITDPNARRPRRSPDPQDLIGTASGQDSAPPRPPALPSETAPIGVTGQHELIKASLTPFKKWLETLPKASPDFISARASLIHAINFMVQDLTPAVSEFMISLRVEDQFRGNIVAWTTGSDGRRTYFPTLQAIADHTDTTVANVVQHRNRLRKARRRGASSVRLAEIRGHQVFFSDHTLDGGELPRGPQAQAFVN